MVEEVSDKDPLQVSSIPTDDMDDPKLTSQLSSELASSENSSTLSQEGNQSERRSFKSA